MILLPETFFCYHSGMERENIHAADLTINDLPELSTEEKNTRQRTGEEDNKRASEICKKYQKGDQFDFMLEKRGQIFSVMLEGVQVGTFILKDEGKTKTIGMIMLHSDLRGKGFGKQLYIKLNDYFRDKDGSTLVSDTMRLSNEAENLWKSLVKDGLAEITDIKTPDGHKVYKFKS